MDKFTNFSTPTHALAKEMSTIKYSWWSYSDVLKASYHNLDRFTESVDWYMQFGRVIATPTFLALAKPWLTGLPLYWGVKNISLPEALLLMGKTTIKELNPPHHKAWWIAIACGNIQPLIESQTFFGSRSYFCWHSENKLFQCHKSKFMKLLKLHPKHSNLPPH